MSQSQQPVALVSGAGRGIGRAIAELLAQKNYRIALVSRSSDQLEQVRTQIGHGLILPTDIRNIQQANQAVQRTIEHFGRLDALINAAGFLEVSPLSSMNLESWHATLETNLSGTFYLCRSAWPHMVAQGGGVIVNLSSPSAQDPFEGLGAYGVSKAGVETLGLVLAREGAPHAIRVHTISPGKTETSMFRQIFTTEQVPTDQTLTPQQVAAVAVQCVTGTLRYTCGSVIHIKKQP